MLEHDELTLKDLCEESGVSERTIRYYIANAILPPAPRSGPGVRYPRAHVARLRLIRQWQEENLPLDQIRKQLAGLDDVEVERLYQMEAKRATRGPEATGGAADYVRRVLGKSAGPPSSPAQMPLMPPPEVPVARSHWERFALDEDVELHVRRPLSHLKNRRVEALLQEARRLLKETPP